MAETLPDESEIHSASVVGMRVVAALDKFRGTATAAEAAAAVGHACWELGFDCDEVPLADGGEGLLDVLGGPNRTTVVTGPLGDPLEAHWRLHRETAVIEMARASGLVLAGGAEANDPMGASTTGVGELIDQALVAGAKRIIVGLGGSATTDGGLGAIRAINAPARLRGVELLVACDVRTTFVDAARVFAPQKGATEAQVAMLTGRLERLAQMYATEFGTDVSELEGSGAAGGLAGGLAALGGTIVGGFELVADEVGLYDRLQGADVVITGEGHLDEQSFAGKVVGGVAAMAAEQGVPVEVIVGDADTDVRNRLPTVTLVELFGLERAQLEPMWCIEQAALSRLRRLRPRPRRPTPPAT
jgi:glycerate 2-kinase